MGATFVHLNPDIFHNPREFIPERWLGEGKGHLDQFIVSFSKGPRTCLGIKYVSSLSTLRLGSRTHIAHNRAVLHGVSYTSSLATSSAS